MAGESEGEGADDLKERKRRERLEQNRISARESRKRKKTMIEELQRTVIGLSRDNKELNERNEGLRHQLMELGSKYPQVVPLHAIMGAGNIGNGNMTQNQVQAQVPAPAQARSEVVNQQFQQQQQQLLQQHLMQQPQGTPMVYLNNNMMANNDNGGNVNVPAPVPVPVPLMQTTAVAPAAADTLNSPSEVRTESREAKSVNTSKAVAQISVSTEVTGEKKNGQGKEADASI